MPEAKIVPEAKTKIAKRRQKTTERRNITMTTIRRFTKNINNRKDLVKKISSITGIASRYTGMPSMAYQIGNFTIEKDGTLVVTMMEDSRESSHSGIES